MRSYIYLILPKKPPGQRAGYSLPALHHEHQTTSTKDLPYVSTSNNNDHDVKLDSLAASANSPLESTDILTEGNRRERYWSDSDKCLAPPEWLGI